MPVGLGLEGELGEQEMKIWLKRVSFGFGEGKMLYLELSADGTLPDTIRFHPRSFPWA